ncbi:MAG TPA: NADPH-dependent FMN reductase [Vicinamibacteria bacterium]|nr:NADPH-dependent FMN reductase [Vicinamibacteria bacterium]
MDPVSILGIAGSLRAASLNKALLRAAQELAPAGLRIDLFERLGDIPPYNADVEAGGDPEAVAAFKEAIARADGLLFATPEYNYGVPGVLKNAVDWASRPPAGSVLQGKPAGIMGATPGTLGTARAQSALRQSFNFTDTPAMLRPEIYVARAGERFDAQMRLTDERTRQALVKFLEALHAWVLRFSRRP